MTGPKPPAPVCARCGMVIKYMLKVTGRPGEPEFVWKHGGPADHEPVLAPAIEPPRLYCDFCLAPDPGWVIDTERDFKILTVAPDGSSLLENFTGGWAACEQCARLVRTGQRRALLTRAVATITASSSGEHAHQQARVAQIHAAFFASGPHSPRRKDQDTH